MTGKHGYQNVMANTQFQAYFIVSQTAIDSNIKDLGDY